MRLKSALIIGSFLAVGLFSSQPSLSADTTKPVEDLPNFHEVEPFLYRGGEPTKKGMEDLKKIGIKTIIDFRNPGEMKFSEKEVAEQLGMKYMHMPMNSAAPSKEYVDTMVKVIEESKSSSPDKPATFIHCAHGSDRTGCMIGIWRVTHDGWDYDKAYQEMRKYWFTPKFTNLSGAVKTYAESSVH